MDSWYAALREHRMHVTVLEILAVGGLLLARDEGDYLAGLTAHEKVAIYWWVASCLEVDN